MTLVSSSYETIAIERNETSVVLTIRRPQQRNALSRQVLAELEAALHNLGRDPSVRGMLLTGAPGRAFVAGADIREMNAMSPIEGEQFARRAQAVTRTLEQLPFAVIACVDGFALGGGCELAMACDFIYATESAKFGQPEVSLGLIPGFGGCVRLPRRIGPARARELIYTGRIIGAAEAHQLGLANRVFPSRQTMLTAAAQTLGEIAQRSASAVAISKRAIGEASALRMDAALDVEARAFRRAFAGADKQEGVAAFLEKRPPRFEPRTRSPHAATAGFEQ